MSEATHSKGDWTIRFGGERYDNGFMIGSEFNAQIAEFWSGSMTDDFRLEVMANGRLIAAAPAMLSALEQAERMLIHYGAHKDHDGGIAALQAVNAAIAKATTREGQS